MFAVVCGPRCVVFLELVRKDVIKALSLVCRSDHLSTGGAVEVGDLLLAIDGTGVRGFSQEQVVQRLRAFPVESVAELTLSRPRSHPLFRRYRGMG